MSNLFEEVLNDATGIEEKLLGPTYPYYKNIRTPSEIGMSSDGSIPALARDIEGLIAYVEVLVQGNGNASSTGRPLGNKFFLKTGAKCLDTKTKQQVDRYIYIDNVPEGNIPFISSGLGVNFSEFKGLIPGTMSDLNTLNPFNLMQSFLSGSMPDCQELPMQVIDINNMSSVESHFVTLTDIKNMDPCSFPNKNNPLSGQGCREAFSNENNYSNYSDNKKSIKHKKKQHKQKNENISLPDDPMVQLYFFGVSLLGIYILYRYMEK